MPLFLLFVYLLFFQLEVYIFILIAFLPISVPLDSLIKGLPFDLSIPAEIFIVIGTLFLSFKFLLENTFNKKILGHPVSIAIFINLTWILITSVTSTLPLVSFKFLASRIWFVFIFYFIFLLIFRKYKKFYTFIWCYTIPFVFVIFYFIHRLSIYGVVNEMRTANWVTKPYFPDHTSYAAAISMLLPVLGFALYILRKSNNLLRLFYLAIFVIFFYGLIMSYTRAAWFSLIIACGFIVPFFMKIKLKYSLLSLFVIILGLYLTWTQIQISLQENRQQSSTNIVKHIESASNVSSDASNLERINRWHSAIKMFKEKPVFGFGPELILFNMPLFRQLPIELL